MLPLDPSDPVIAWLLDGDPAIRWQVYRDLLDAPPELVAAERERLSSEGWSARLLNLQDPDGRWGQGIYNPKWTSTHYTLLCLCDLGLSPGNSQALRGCGVLLDTGFYRDGGINFYPHEKHSETCITGMSLGIFAHFQIDDPRLHALAAHLLDRQMPDGGWNCRSYRGDLHSSFHTTLLALEGLLRYENWQPQSPDLIRAGRLRAHEFLFNHRLYRSHRTGHVVDSAMTRFSFPPRWRYDVLRALDYFRAAHTEHDARMDDALRLVHQRRLPDGRWLLQNRQGGRVFFDMETFGEPGRWNTLRALRVLHFFPQDVSLEPA